MDDEGQRKLDQAYKGLEDEAPDSVARAIRWLRQPKARKIRWPLGLLLIAGGVFGFLPVLGFEFIPLGLLLIAQDVPILRKPVGAATIWLEQQWIKVRKWWQRKKTR